MQLFGELGGLVDRLDDDPFVVGAAERLAFDELAGESVAQQPGTVFLDRAAAADLQFHEFAGAHAGDGSQYQHRRGPERSDEGRGLFLVQRRRPWHCALSVVTVNGRSLTTEHRFCSNDFQRIFQRSAEWCEPVVVELAEPCLTGQDPGSDRYQRVIG